MLFKRHAEQMEKGARALHALFADQSGLAGQVEEIAAIELAADRITHETIDLLHRTFITPFDREDIHLLITKMDDVLDLMEDVAQSIALYDVKRIRPDALALEKLCLDSVEVIREMVGLLSDMKHADEIIRLSKEVKRLEDEADNVMRTAVAKLFREEQDTKELIKAKEIYELLEMVTDRCDDVADIARGVVLENA